MPSLSSTPQATSQILSKGIEVGVNSFPRLFLFTTLAGFLGLIPILYLVLRIGDVAITREVLSGARDATWYLIELVCFLLGVLLQGILVLRLDNLVQRGATDFRNESRYALQVLLPLFVSSVVFVCAVLVGYVLLIVPGLILTVSLAFFQFCVVLDRQGPIAALNRSHTLVWGNWWRTFWALLIMLLVIALIAVVLLVPFALALGMHTSADTGRNLLIQGVLQMVAEAIFSPFALAVMYTLYNDLKVRHALSSNQ
ncbi:MAG TPA: hypothetical protein VFX47_00955 [Gammaproteobacteria bacterium]|nr:hypothetical protein [Gammaproteobacteria bacterium]